MKNFLLILSLTFLPLTTQAQSAAFFETGLTRMGAGIWFPNSEKGKGFEKSSSGFMGQVEVKRSNNWVSLLGGIRAATASGKETFFDGSTELDLAYTFYGIEAELGLLLHLIPSKDFAFQPYVGAVAIGGFGYLKLPQGTYTNLSHTESKTTAGYELIGGVELAPGRKQNQISYSIWGEGRLRTVRGGFAGKSDFQLDGFLLLIGMGF
ncbi:MAG: hypothetical protein K2X47_20430 [Bdellovibrionales bacterium]|nr:hypothetical protein [Bdellovibrionales bacterium]